MVKSSRGDRAFTLIELLIVVAIIGILAAIAIPNFLLAQVRSKVARVESDMRTLATAMELYYVDHSTYPNSWERRSRLRHPSAGNVLSTPVEYISNPQINDPFFYKNSGDPGRLDKVFLSIYSGRTDSADHRDWGKTVYSVISFGPDRTDNTRFGGFPFERQTTNGFWIGLYDPTNGTVSQGDITRSVPRDPKVWVMDTGSHLRPGIDDPYDY